jgi:cardiolipin synthase
MNAARQRGVKIEVIVPGPHNDSGLALHIGRALYDRILDEGIEVYEYQPTMFHTKVMIVDNLWLVVGSANFDNRSFRLNDEINLAVFDQELAEREIEQFEADKRASKAVSAEEWRQRPWIKRAAQHAMRPFRSQV